MRNTLSVLKVEMRRSVCSKMFLLQLGLTFIWMLLNCLEQLSSEHGAQGIFVFTLLNTALTNSLNLSYLILILGTVCFSWSYCSDLTCGYGKEVVRRSGIRAYGVAKIIAVAVSSFAAAVAAIPLFIVFALLCGFSWTSPNAMLYTGAYLNIATEGYVLGYLMCRCLVTGMSCSLAAVVSLCASAYIKNMYVSMLIPSLLFFLFEIFVRASKFSLMTVMFGQAFPEDPVASLVWAVLYLTVLILIFGIAFLFRIKKECCP